MAASKYLTSPPPTKKMPSGIPFIIGNEAAERFSYYGMRAILFVFMTEYLMGPSGREPMTPENAQFWYHVFGMAVYFFPLAGAFVSDALWGKYRTILTLSIVYCLGHLALALGDTRWHLFTALVLIAIGSGGIKPCVSAHVGDQFGTMNQHLLPRVFAWFYFSINVGAAASQYLTPELLNDSRYGPSVAFGVPGVLMFVATVVFWLGRHRFVHVPPAGPESVKRAFRGEGLAVMRKLLLIYLCVAVFFSIFEQTGSSWVRQAKRMDLHLGRDWLPSQIGAINPVLILTFIPLFSYVIYPRLNRFYTLTPLRKISIGMFMTVLASAATALIEGHISGGEVVMATSEADPNRWPAVNLIDGKADGSGWVSGNNEQHADSSLELVLRLRERRAWNIASVRINPYTELEEFLRKQPEEPPDDLTAAGKSCWAKDIEVLVSDSRNGPWERVGTLQLQQRNAAQTLEFPMVSTEYVQVRIHSNWGGDYTSLGEIQVLSSDPLPAGADSSAGDVWPNVSAIGYKPNIAWQLLAYVLLTSAEVMVSITCLEFSYTQAPTAVKSFIMSLFLLSITVGNGFTAAVNWVIQNKDGSSKLEGPNYFWFFTAVMLATAVAFIFVARFYRGRTYIQGDQQSEELRAEG